MLHVTDCLNAGVGNLIKEILSDANPKTAFLLWDSHSDSPEYNFDKSFSEYDKRKWRRGIIRRIIQLRKMIVEINPTYIHAHSSLAGFYVRMFTYRRKKIYSPHCFSFDRLDISKVKRLTYYLVEYFLHFLTFCYVANWPIEVIEISKFRPRKKIYLLRPLDTFAELNALPLSIKKNATPCFIGIGRIRPQKDPKLFAEIATMFNQVAKGKFIWIGEGDKELKKLLVNAGVMVIPWAEKSQLTKYYLQATATLITSKWESGPLTMFESLKYSTPVVIKKNKSSNAFGLQSFEKTQDLVNECIKIVNSDYNQDLLNSQKEKCEISFSDLAKSYGIKPYSDLLENF